MATVVESGGAAESRSAAIPKGAYYALIVLALANVLNYLDRQIVSILAQSIKADLKLDDADLGFLLGTIKPAIEREVHKEFDKRFGKHAEHKEPKGPKGHKA